MFCPKCGTQNPETGKFCRSCGTDLGNVSAALSGNFKPSLAPTAPVAPPAPLMLDRRGRRMNWESALTKVFMGVAFMVVSIVLGVSGMGRGWWFWLLIPAFAMLGSGIAQCVQLKKCEQNPALSSGSQPAAASQNEIPAVQTNAALPPTQTDYVKPPRASIYDTGELYEKPPSVTEGTTRHLEINNEGETMTLPKK
jgi:hypothetical protein